MIKRLRIEIIVNNIKKRGKFPFLFCNFNHFLEIKIGVIIRLEGESMKVLLTGACGNVGIHTLEKLVLREDIHTIALDLDTKKNRKKLKPYEGNIELAYGSILDEPFMRKILKDIDVVIHLAAIIPPHADKNPELTRNVNYFGTKMIVDILKENKKGFLIFSSSISVYGDRVKNPWITVHDKLIPSDGDYYAQVKIETEKYIIESGIPFTIFRLTGIMGNPMLDPLMFHMPLDTSLEIASVWDTATAFVNSINHLEPLNGKVFNLGGGPSCRTTYREFLKNMFSCYGISPKYLKEKDFAEQNFHCGYYQDSHELNDILNFQTDSLESYYSKVRKGSKKTRLLCHLFGPFIFLYLEKKSEPLQSKKKKNQFLIHRFFKEKE